jgi:hypothetical protein
MSLALEVSMSEEIKVNIIRNAAADSAQRQPISEMEIAGEDPITIDSVKEESVQLRAMRKIMRENADVLKRLADS